jgi:hypothetical protein
MRSNLALSGTWLLLAATIVVGLSILLEGAVSRALNGMAGVMWFGAAAMLVTAGLRLQRSPRLWVGLVALTSVVAFVVRPSDLLLAVIGFVTCGALALLLAGDGRLLWSTLVVGLYLPLHIGTAVIKAVVRTISGTEASIRTDPPPTAAMVPLVMLGAALLGGLMVQRFRSGASQDSVTGLGKTST